MIAGLLQLLVFQGIGELIARFAVPAVPGPVLGLLALLAWLRVRGGAGDALEGVAGAFSRNLGLLFVPAAVGVVMFVPQLREHLPALLATLVASVVATIAVSAWLLKVLSPRDAGDDGDAADASDASDAGPTPGADR